AATQFACGIDRVLKFRGYVSFPLDLDDPAAWIAADTLLTQPVAHIGKIVQAPLAPAECDRLHRKLAVSFWEQLRVPALGLRAQCKREAGQKQSPNSFRHNRSPSGCRDNQRG